MTTIEQLEKAETVATAARAALEEALGDRFATSSNVNNRREANFIAERNFESLRRQYAAEVEAQTARDAAEQAARKKLDAGTKQLDASVRGLADAVEAARAALAAVQQKAEAHAALVDRLRGELSALGLTGGTRPDGRHQSTTVLPRGLMIDGRQWIGFAPAAVMAFAMRHGAAPNRLLSDRLRGVCGMDEPHLARALTDLAK